MICINCFSPKTKVTNSRTAKKTTEVWRRRQCARCNSTFTTYERPSLEQTEVYGKSRHKALFSLSKLTLSIAAAFPHDLDTAQRHSLSLAQTVEQLLLRDVQQPSADDICAITHQVLQRFDALAALQYAARHELITPTRRRGRPSVR